MKKFMMLGALVAVMVAALAIPALAKDGFHFGSVNQERLERWQDRAEKKGLSFDEYLLYRFGGFEARALARQLTLFPILGYWVVGLVSELPDQQPGRVSAGPRRSASRPRTRDTPTEHQKAGKV